LYSALYQDNRQNATAKWHKEQGKGRRQELCLDSVSVFILKAVYSDGLCNFTKTGKDRHMLDVRVNLIKNRLYLTLGWTQRDKLNKAFPAIAKAADKLSPGFSCITRVIDARGIQSSDIREIQKVQQYLIDCGMRRVVRVGEETGKRLLRLAGMQYESICTEAASPEEAETLLDAGLPARPYGFLGSKAGENPVSLTG